MSKIALTLLVILMISLVCLHETNGQKKKNVPKRKNGINLKNIRNNGKKRTTVKPKKFTTKKPKVIKDSGYLTVKNGKLTYKNNQVFLSGANIAYKNYGNDFGNGAYSSVKSQMETWLSQIAAAGGNCVRVFLHANGANTPKLDSQGYATGQETASLIQELGQFLDAAQTNNLFVIINLWHAGDKWSPQIINLFRDVTKLDRYVEKVLKPLAAGLKNKKALAIWDMINEPEGSVVKDTDDDNPCFNTRNLIYSGGDWTLNNITMKELLRSANHQAAAIKAADPKVLKYIASREEESSDYCDLCRNYFTDKCLVAAGGEASGTMDLYHMESFTWQNKYYYWSPMKKMASDYKLTKPIVVGSISSVCSESNSSAVNFNYVYNNGYSGVLNWQYSAQGYCFDTAANCDAGMKAIKDMTSNGMIKITIS